MGDARDFGGLPGAEHIAQGLEDLRRGSVTASALLLLIASPRLRHLGIDVPVPDDISPPYEHRLYELLEETNPSDAYIRYNSLLRRIVSFSDSLEHFVNR
jgi:hypothetical protein